MKVTINTIASECGVSKGTVSRILNGNEDRFSAATIKVVRETAERLGFRANIFAKAASEGIAECVGLFLDPQLVRSQVPKGLIHHLVEAQDLYRRSVVVNTIPDEMMNGGDELMRILGSKMVSGVILNYHAMIPPAMPAALKAQRIPHVWLNRKMAFNAVYFDEYQSTIEMVDALVQQGHTNILYEDSSFGIIEPQNLHYSREDRMRGYEDGMKSHGLSLDVIAENQTMPFPQNVLQRLKSGTTAVIFASPGHARAVHQLVDYLPEFERGNFRFAGFMDHPDLHVMDMVSVEPMNETAKQATAMLEKHMANPKVQLPSASVINNLHTKA